MGKKYSALEGETNNFTLTRDNKIVYFMKLEKYLLKKAKKITLLTEARKITLL